MRQKSQLEDHSEEVILMGKILVKCEICAKEFYRYRSQIREHIFCSRHCNKQFTSRRMHDFNVSDNPMNSSGGWTPEKRESVRRREQINKGKCSEKTYPKDHGMHEHRRVAEQMLGRPLRKGEVVHHIDRNKHNNSPDNLMIFPSQKEHIRWHQEHGDL